MEIPTTVDNVKKGRILTLALIISISILIFKVTQTTDIVNPIVVLLRSLVYFAVAYVGLIWAFKFQVTLHSLLYILPQSAMFIMSEVIFLEMFFFRRVGRVYEILILVGMLILLFIGTYVVFLMSNVFNVATVKEIPLIQAARTVSFLATLIATFFLALGLLDGNLDIIPTTLILAFAFFSLVFFHLKHMDLGKERLGEYTILVLLFMLSMFISTAIVSQSHEVIALAPTIGAFVALEIITKKQRNMLTPFTILQYIFFITAIFVAAFVI
ncbi:MAG TPA: hypothetical protein PLV59_00380 [Candidatus Dojkabacteria bacterium]|nr:hypothetical protein [Candidatus Dojkabacteria bacterium]